MKYYLYNSKANNGIKPSLPEGANIVDALKIDYKDYFSKLSPEDEVVLVGGDGTINYFINAVDVQAIRNNVYLYSSGTGNDFLNDIEGKAQEEISLNKYFKDLPTVYVNGLERKFINGIGYGIDGYCCEVADQIKEKTPNAKINYSGIAVKGLLFHFKPRHATIIVDGQSYEYDYAWIAASMKGRYYGGGMDIAPAQDRFSDHLSVVCYHAKSNLKALMNFTSIFKGEHVKKHDLVAVHEGKEITVKFDKPCALQIDGETVLNVSEYTVRM